MLIYSSRLVQNWHTKAPSGGLQQRYPRGGMEELQITKPMCWIPLTILEEVALQGYPGREPFRNGPCRKDENQIIAEVIPLGAQEQDWGGERAAGRMFPVPWPLQSPKVPSDLVPPLAVKLCGALFVDLSEHFPFFPQCLWENWFETPQVWSASHWRTCLIS